MQKITGLSRIICGGWVNAVAIIFAVLTFGITDFANAQSSFFSPQDLGDAEWGIVTNDSSLVIADTNAPSIAGNNAFAPVWYTWTAPRDGDVELDTVGSLHVALVTNIDFVIDF